RTPVGTVTPTGYPRPGRPIRVPAGPASGPAGGGVILRHDAGRDAPPVADTDARVLRPRPDVAAAPAARGAARRPAPPSPSARRAGRRKDANSRRNALACCLPRSISDSTPSSPTRTAASAG